MQKWRQTRLLVAGLAIGLFVVTAATIFVARSRTHKLLVRPISTVLPADGRDRTVLLVSRQDGRPIKAAEITAQAIGSQNSNDRDTHLVQNGNAVEIWMRAPVTPGEQRIRIWSQRQAIPATVRFAASEVDSFADGMPDALRLHSVEDRAAFRQWFWRLAETQAELPDPEKAPEVQDCAALLRYAYREALKPHDAEWAEAQHIGDVAFPSVSQWQYPKTILGAALFRVRPGPFQEGDETDGAFAQFADAHALMSWNTYRVGRDLHSAKPGDLIFYRQLEQNSPYHSMVITGRDADWVVYHTGPIDGRKGEMRRMTLTDLLHHPDARWRPVKENSNFLGVFRWNVLREGD